MFSSMRSTLFRHVMANARLVALHAIPMLLIIGTAVPTHSLDFRGYPACSDGYDNDSDGRTDYPRDEECFSLEDDSEGLMGQGLFVGVSDGRDAVRAGGSLVYRITLQSDRDTEREVNVRFRIPNQTNVIEASNAGRESGTFILWNRVMISRGQTRTLTVNVEVNPYARAGLLLVAEVEAGGERATDTTRVTDTALVRSPLSITITDNKQAAEPNEELDYVITVKNTGNADREFTLRTTLPTEIGFLSASDNHRRDGRLVAWDRQTIGAGETKKYFVSARIIERLSGFYSVVVKAYVLNTGEQGSDTTFIQTGPFLSDLSIDVAADRDEVVQGDEVTYTLHIRNSSNMLATHVDVSNALPMFTEFVSATEGGRFTGDNGVRWTGLTVSPQGSRTLKVTGRVRSDAPIGAQLKNTAIVSGVNGDKASKTVEVVQSRSSRSRSSGRRDDTRVGENIFLQKAADRSEVLPGDVITYTLSIRNTLGRTIRNIKVNDRLEARTMTLVSGALDATRSDGSLEWMIRELQPNEVWQRTYRVQIASTAPHGLSLSNIVSVSGADIASLSLTERVRTTQLGVLTAMPSTGAGLDTFAAGFLGLIGAVQTLWLRRKIALA